MHATRTVIELPSTDQQPVVSIVVMFTHDAEMARWCLESIAAHGRGSQNDRVETIVVLNDSSPAVRELVLEQTTGAVVIDTDVNVGTMVGWNLALASAHSPKMLVMHEDAAMVAGMLDTLAATLDAHPEAGVVAPWTAPEAGAPPHNVGWLLARNGRQLHIEPRMLPEDLRNGPYAVDVASSAMSMWRRDALKQAGGFDERRYPAVGTDIVACTGLWSHGFSAMIDPTSTAVHRTGAMDNAPGPLTGPYLRNFLYENYRDHWRANWGEFGESELPDGTTFYLAPETLSVDDRDPHEVFADGLRHAASRAEHRTASPLARRAQRPLSAGDDPDRWPESFDAEIRERVAAAHDRVADGYHRWLIEHHAAEMGRAERLDARNDELGTELSEAHAELRELRDRIDALQPRSDALQAIYEGRLWRLRGRLRRLARRGA